MHSQTISQSIPWVDLDLLDVDALRTEIAEVAADWLPRRDDDE